MPAVSMNSLQRLVSSTSTRSAPRKTRWSVVKGDLEPPYLVDHAFSNVEGVVHTFGRIMQGDACGRIMQGDAWDSCCRIQLAGITRIDAEAPTCVLCAICPGCHACRDGH